MTVDQRGRHIMPCVLHIGLGKCASTSLQGLWTQSENYNYFSLHELTTQTRNLIVDKRDDLDSAVDAIQSMNVKFPEFDNNKMNVFSSEGVTFSFITDFQYGYLTQLKQQAMAVLLKGLSTKVLMLVRNPIEWITSAYAQQVKEGGSMSFDEYLVGARQSIYHNLNINFIKSVFEKQGFEVIILPIELMKLAEDEFWESYEDRLGVARPSLVKFPTDKRTANITNSATIPVHAKLNQILAELSLLVRKSSAYVGEENKIILDALELSRKWGTRAALHDLSRIELEQLERVLDIGSVTLNGDSIPDTDLKTHLQNNFIDPLLEKDVFPFQTILAAYQRSIFG